METTEPDAWSIRSLLSAKLGKKVSFFSTENGAINFHTSDEKTSVCAFFPEYDLLKLNPLIQIESRELRHLCFILCNKGFYIQFNST